MSISRGGEFVRRRVEAGDPNFVRMWDEMGTRRASIGAGNGSTSGTNNS